MWLLLWFARVCERQRLYGTLLSWWPGVLHVEGEVVRGGMKGWPRSQHPGGHQRETWSEKKKTTPSSSSSSSTRSLGGGARLCDLSCSIQRGRKSGATDSFKRESVCGFVCVCVFFLQAACFSFFFFWIMSLKRKPAANVPLLIFSLYRWLFNS